jgi:type II restriction enzyme
MSNSPRLSDSLIGNIKNAESQQQDIKIKSIVQVVLNRLKAKYPLLALGYQPQLPLHDIEVLVNKEEIKSGSDSFIRPDGGFLWVEIEGMKHYILVSEQKKQGTNDQRHLDGKGIQSKGNAAERLGKNIKAFDVLFGDVDIYPFIVFLQGCDFFDAESTIGDRIRTIAMFSELNKINLYWKKLQKNTSVGGSYFMRGHSYREKPGTSDWTEDEMLQPMLHIAEESLKYYLSKYGKGEI